MATFARYPTIYTSPYTGDTVLRWSRGQRTKPYRTRAHAKAALDGLHLVGPFNCANDIGHALDALDARAVIS